MITSFLNSDTIRLNVQVTDWQDAIAQGGQLLVDTGAVAPAYIQSMIDAAHKFGPYFVMIPGCALPHAQISEDVRRSSMSLITLQTPVDFLDSEKNPVWLVICLAAENPDAHLQSLSRLAGLLDAADDLAAIRAAAHIDEVIAILHKHDAAEQ